MNKKRTSRIIETTKNVNGRDVSFLYKITNTRNSYIRLSRDNKIVVTVSRYTTPEQMGKFISTHLEKFVAMIDRKEKHKLFDNNFSFVHSDGCRININWTESSRNKISGLGDNIDGTYSKSIHKKKLISKYIIDQNSHKFESIYIECCQKIGITPIIYQFKWMNSRWGYFSPKNKNVVFSIQLLMHESNCWSYVIIHELCHSVHLNHSRDFWNLVKAHCPDYKNIKNVLNLKSKI